MSGTSDEALWDRFDRGRMQKLEIYPVQAWDDPEAELRAEYIGCFHELKELVHDASAADLGILVSLGDGEQEYGSATEAILYGPFGPTIRRWCLIFFGSVTGFMTLLVLGVCFWRYRRMAGGSADSDPQKR